GMARRKPAEWHRRRVALAARRRSPPYSLFGRRATASALEGHSDRRLRGARPATLGNQLPLDRRTVAASWRCPSAGISAACRAGLQLYRVFSTVVSDADSFTSHHSPLTTHLTLVISNRF